MISHEFPTSQCLLGVARADITPPVGIYHRMWGAATHESATGVHRPLTATALILAPWDDPNDLWAILAVDHCLLWAPEMTKLRAAVAQASALPQERILVAFSHTHAAGMMDRSRSSLPGGELIGPYLARLAQTLGELLQQARNNLAPTTLTCGIGQCNLAAERDFWDAHSGQFVCGFNPDGPADDTVLVIRATRCPLTPGPSPPQGRGEKIVATIVNYACHPTTLAWQNTLISPDFPGAMREVVENATGAPCIFLQGASGDLGPRDGFVADTAVADRNGRQLGYAVLSALEALSPPATRFVYEGPVLSGATLGTWRHHPLSNDDLANKRVFRWQHFEIPLPYRHDMPSREQSLAELSLWQSRKDAARHAKDESAARDAHALIERLHRRLTRLEHLPTGAAFPLPVVVGRIGDAVWLFLEGEHYQWLQQELRRRFPEFPLIITTLTNGSCCAYLPTAESYGKGIYQESIAVLEKGCLETLAAEIVMRIKAVG
ncbi:MAG: hypothetical protein L0Y72_18280 [Gemmataceae bacterium]|nr:hypothetical protein [Gemmataceae bacterium]MCI0740999.1 hypothetical protein [Gemmataceae bacterium]